MMRTIALVLGLTSAAVSGLSHAQSGAVWYTKKDVPLRSTPSNSARQVASLPTNTAVSRTAERSGPWVKVITGEKKQTGWVHLFEIQNAPPTAVGGTLTSALRTLGRANESSTGKNVATATAGIRGLDAEDIAKATPNPQGVRQAEAFQVKESEARQFASAYKIRARNVDELPAPDPSKLASVVSEK